MENSVDPDEMVHYELSHLNLHYLQRYMLWSAGLKELSLCILQGFSSAQFRTRKFTHAWTIGAASLIKVKESDVLTVDFRSVLV